MYETTIATITSGVSCDAVRLEEEDDEEQGDEREAEHGHGHRADPHRRTRDHREPGQVRQRDPADGADEHAGEHRAAAEAAQRERVGKALAGHEQEQRSDRPGGGALDQPRELVLAGEEDVGARLVGRLDEDQDEDADPDACERRQDEAPPGDDRLERERQPAE